MGASENHQTTATEHQNSKQTKPWAGSQNLPRSTGSIQARSREPVTCCPWCHPSRRRALLPIVSPIAPPCAAARGVACCAAAVVSPVAQPCAAACHATCRAGVCCCPLYCLSVAPPCAVARRAAHRSTARRCHRAASPCAAGARVSLWCEGGQHQVVEPAYRTW